MDTETEERFKILENRVAMLEKVVADFEQQAKIMLTKFENHPVFGNIVRMMRG